MLGYIFIFYVGYYFYRLADNFGKYKWLYAVIGIAVYYGVYLISNLMYVYANKDDYKGALSEMSDEFSVVVISFASGLFFCVLLFQLLYYRWGREKKIFDKKSINDIQGIKSNE